MRNITHGRVTAFGLISVCIVMSLTSLIHATRTIEAPQAAPTPVAVVDWLRVTESLNSWTEAKAALNSERQSLEQELDQKLVEIENLSDQLQVLSRGTPTYDETARQFGEMSAQFQGWKEFHNQRLVAKELIEQIKVYNSICDAAQAVADQEGYWLVLWDDSASKTANLDQQQLEDAAQMISTRMVLYAAGAKVDITQKVVDYLNSQ
ncbi:MAG: OmpH family outer membrane protein [Planctomycetes bacterium]|nr:OmpH family outer membrane protein [Planctomycetota bacterium]NOG55262.1 OmpH family outer membrane protein [Planctomycetota bacterium]